MIIQVAIDRVTLEEASNLMNSIGDVDIIEIGTSLSRIYGLESVRTIKKIIKKETSVLVDIKTIDQGEYEFKQYYKEGADSLTVMGVSSPETIDSCYKVSEMYKKEMMIDLLECSESKISKIDHYENAIYCIHYSSDSQKDYSIKQIVETFNKKFPSIKRIAIAGGINLNKLKELKELDNINLERVIVGSYITKSENPKAKINELKGVIKNWN